MLPGMLQILEQLVLGVIECALRLETAHSVFRLVFLYIPLIPLELNNPRHDYSIANEICSVKRYIILTL